MHKSIFFYTIIAFTILAFVSSCKEEKVEKEIPPKVVEEEEEQEESKEFPYASGIYKQNCISCHEAKLTDFLDRKWENGNSWNEVNKSIKNGHASIEKASFVESLPDSAFDKLTDYILIGLENRTINSFEEETDWSGIIKSDVQTFQLDTIAVGLENPWGLAFLPNGDMLVTDRNGKMYRHTESKILQEIKGVPAVQSKGQGGLLDVEVHPNFASNQTIYLSYSKPKGEKEVTTAVLKAKLINDKLVDQKIIFEALPYRNTRHHFGSRLEFDNDGYLFITVGDRGKRDDNPQNLANHGGKIHRINDDGSIPKDNPFVNTPNTVPSIWSYGHRNPQGLVFDKNTGIWWETEHAPRGGDEVNIIKKGKNYGWPLVSFGINYSGSTFTDLTEKEGMEQPVHYYMPSPGTCGLTLVTGDKYPAWKGNLLAGSLRFQYISRLILKDNKVIGEEKLLKNIGRLRAVVMGNDGYIYFTVEAPGLVFRIRPL